MAALIKPAGMGGSILVVVGGISMIVFGFSISIKAFAAGVPVLYSISITFG